MEHVGLAHFVTMFPAVVRIYAPPPLPPYWLVLAFFAAALPVFPLTFVRRRRVYLMVAAGVIGVLWAFSYGRGIEIVISGSEDPHAPLSVNRYTVGVREGLIHLSIEAPKGPDPKFGLNQYGPFRAEQRPVVVAVNDQGFTYLSDMTRLSVPCWLPAAAALAAFAVLLARSARTRRRATRGLCAACGYDLRATPGRCPECGAAAAL